METKIKSYLCGAVPVQKGLSEPLMRYHEGMSQDGAVMRRHEEARQLYSGGRRVGLDVARVPVLRAKRGFLTSGELLEGSVRLSLPATLGAWRCHLEKMAREFNRRSPTLSPSLTGVKRCYKVSSERNLLGNGEEKSSLLASSLRMAAYP